MQEDANPVHNFVYSSELVAFVKAANACCTYLEELKGSEGRDFITESLKHLSSVYTTFLNIGETEPVMESGLEPKVSEQEWSTLFQRVSMILGPYNDMLRMVGEEEFDQSELVNHTVSEDLADLYQELRDFTASYSLGMEELMNDAAWDLKIRFNEHWGTKLLRALQALHELLVSGVDPTEKE